MEWSEVTVRVPSARVDDAAAIAQMCVPYGIYIEDYSDLTEEAPRIAHIDLIDEELLAKDRTHALVHLYVSPAENPGEAASFLTQRLTACGIEHEVSMQQVEEADWATAWKKYYHPVRVGKRLVICPSWESTLLAPHEVKLELDPGMAFGTGTHETTRLCLTLLEEYVTPATPVLDVGCGSGILSIAALLLGAPRAVGVDIDEVAVRVAKENAAMNHVEGSVQYVCGDLAREVSGTFGVVCANIVADVIIRFAPDIPRYLAPGGVFIASGIITERAGEVEEALAEQGFTVTRREEQNGWAALAAVHAL